MIIYGKQLFLHLLKHYPSRIKTVFLPKKCDTKLFSHIANVTQKICNIDERKAQALCHGGNHQGFIAEIEPLELTPFSAIKQGSFLVILDEVTDVGNIGAIVRSAYAFGADGLILSGMKTCNLEAILRTSSAAAFELPIALVPSTKDMLNELKQIGFTLYGADMDGVDVQKVTFAPKRALIMGSEGKGLSPKVKERLDTVVSIKMARAFDSLNVSAAAAILCDRIANG
ncbi:23S rRNA (guanosine(2251)-2'-O)-methyltransferase RlmB [Sulfurospirillum deleyianum]|uniref:RNA methyltransferase, TrmH family, group 3 n=1 Tax=Sulfurospirillum deleyianum (strain ATCC 51133 / DSM 6946 / 5175) TaxID=525898 RepID=D1AZ65_SULD5|nr:23S rRNA (guanosine(2251)-2'-O)-methyltransferase RlmB [Sulfurospirillum deleyianum]ACZ11203.1 RNA methyltransferase, TrmH family, group 3 [Sulfurospirillum deleyianum DSM 6946]